jgi:release factor glutamine methyltransferase
MKSIKNLLTKGAIKLKLKLSNVKNPHFEAELLLSAILKKPREWLLTHSENKINFIIVMRYALCVMRRSKGTPLAYLTHTKGFYGRDFYVNKHVLCPRPETEMFISHNVEHITHNDRDLMFVDVGTGSGCIIISLIKELQKKSLHVTRYAFYAVDISKKALKVAKRNAETHKVYDLIKFHQGSLLEPIKGFIKTNTSKTEMVILANLPYLTPGQVKNSPSIQKEPKIALEAGCDGLKYYRKLFSQILELKKVMSYELPRYAKAARSRPFTIFLEIDDSQKNSIQKLIKEKLPDSLYKIKTDLRGESRLVIINF